MIVSALLQPCYNLLHQLGCKVDGFKDTSITSFLEIELLDILNIFYTGQNFSNF